MSTSKSGRVVFSYKSEDTTADDPVTVTLAPDYEKVQEKTQVNWTIAATQVLIASWVTRKEQFRKLPTREVYSLISNDLKEMGFIYSGEQCGIKWRSLKSSFLKVKSSMASRDKPCTWVHFQAMAEALQEETPFTDYQQLMQDLQTAESPQNDDNDTKYVSLPSSPSGSLIQLENTGRRENVRFHLPPVKKKLPKRKMEWMKCFSEMKEEWGTRREERQKMHKERMELGYKKLKVMEELISVLKSK